MIDSPRVNCNCITGCTEIYFIIQLLLYAAAELSYLMKDGTQSMPG